MLRFLLPALWASTLLASPLAFHREGRGPAILLVHGFGGNQGVWEGLAPGLARTHTVVRVDLPGSGTSPAPEMVEGAVDFESVARQLAALVQREKLAPCLIVGHSMGGPLAALTVLQDPAAFRGLLLVDSFLATLPPSYLQKILSGLDQDPAATLRAFYGPMSSGEAQRERLVQEALRLPLPVLKGYLQAMTRDAFKGRARLLKLPVLQLEAGPEAPDPATRLAQRTQRGFQDLPNLRVLNVPASKHWIMWDDPKALLEALAAFEATLGKP